jgi:RNA polymerase sigma factor (sigma-70 family)
MQSATETSDDRDVDYFLDGARHYPLLSAAEECAADRRKWEATDQMLACLVTARAGRDYLTQLAARCIDDVPDIAQFEQREDHFLLRRELADYLPQGPRAAALADLARNLATDPPAAPLLDLARALQMPASLVAGISRLLLRTRDYAPPCPVADALVAWHGQWPPPQGETARLDSADQRHLQRLLADYEAARERLTLHNLRLVYAIAARFRDKGVPMPDLLQEGTLGLLRAVDKYHHGRGYRFSTYAFNWISQAVRRHVAERGSLIRYPSQVQAQVARLHRERLALLERSGMEPTVAQLSAATGLTADKVHSLRGLGNLTRSLDEPASADFDRTLGELLPDVQSPAVSHGSETRSLHRVLREQMACLEPNERQVILGRWGMLHDRPLSRAELADTLSVSREWVRQLEVSAMAKLRDSQALREVYLDHHGFDPDSAGQA